MAEEAAPQEEHPLVRAFQPRKRILWYGDSPTASTGFGTVSRHLCRALYRTGLYEIDILGINYFGDFYDRADFPYQIVPAKLGDPNDPHGRRMLLDILGRSKVYDAIFILNDSYVIKGVAGELRKFIKEQGLPTKVIYYFPVDCCVQPESADAFYSPDVLVAFTEFAKEEALKTFSDLKDIRVIYHGVDPEAYRPLAEESRNLYRRQYFGIEDPGTKLFINVNRNSPRKNLAQTVLAFSEYFRRHPDSRLYLHTPIRDMMLDLEPAIRGCGLEVNREVFFPQNYSPAHGVPDSVVNQIYNAADCFLNTTTGEGFGLCVGSDSLVTSSRGPVLIQDIVEGDSVLAEDGELHKVLNKTSRTASTLVLRANGCPALKVTDEHPILALRKHSRNAFHYYANHPIVPEWVPARSLKSGDLLAIPRPKCNVLALSGEIDVLDYIGPGLTECDIDHTWFKMGYSPKMGKALSISDICQRYNVSKRVAEDARRAILGRSLPSRGLPGTEAYRVAEQVQKDGEEVCGVPLKIKRYIPIDKELLLFLGWYLAEGNSAGGTRIEIDLHKNEINVACTLGQWIKKTFGVEAIVEQRDNKSRVRASSGILSLLFSSLCGNHAQNKRIHPDLLRYAHSLGPLIRGLFLGDACNGGSSWNLTTTSRELAWQVRHILAINGIFASLRQYPPGKLGNHPQWIVSVGGADHERLCSWAGLPNSSSHKRARAERSIVTPSLIFVPIRGIERGDMEHVFDLSVDSVHSFTANGIVVHNSVPEAMAAGCPVIVPDNTSMPEIVGDDGDRGIVYPTKELFYIDNSGLRKIGRLGDITAAVDRLFSMSEDERLVMTTRARAWCLEHSWKKKGEQWAELLREVLAEGSKVGGQDRAVTEDI